MSLKRRRGASKDLRLWRVKDGKRDVYVSKLGQTDCEKWIRDHQGEFRHALRLMPPVR